MSRLRLNQELRNKISSRWRVHAEAEHTDEKEKFFKERESFLQKQNDTWDLAQQCVTRQYPKDDVKMAHYLQDKYPNVNTIAKDSCFHFGYMAKKDGEEDEYEQESYSGNHTEQDDKYITKHFDFRLDGNINGSESSRQNDFAFAYFRDELKGREGCNPDITIEMENKDSNPHWTKYQDANDKYLGCSSGRGNLTSYSDKWDKEYELDLIGREYCRDRQINVSKAEYKTFEDWQIAKGQLIMAHEKWIESILNQMKEIKTGLKMYRFLDEAIKLCNNLDLNVQDHEIIKVNSTGLTIYNPDNLADRIKGMKNKNISRGDKIKARILYEKNAQSGVVN